jgi:uncharacterized protein
MNVRTLHEVGGLRTLAVVFDTGEEVVSLLGNVACTEAGVTKVHAHVVVGRRDGSTAGGHLLAATVRPTLEVIAVETPAHLRREVDEATGLPLLPS